MEGEDYYKHYMDSSSADLSDYLKNFELQAYMRCFPFHLSFLSTFVPSYTCSIPLLSLSRSQQQLPQLSLLNPQLLAHNKYMIPNPLMSRIFPQDCLNMLRSIQNLNNSILHMLFLSVLQSGIHSGYFIGMAHLKLIS